MINGLGENRIALTSRSFACNILRANSAKNIADTNETAAQMR